jgi:predicted RNA binding protein YcfA (HicA-like mRNA interferase family)
MLTSSRDIIRRLQADGWTLVRVKGSHHVFRHAASGDIIVVPHPKKDLGKGLIQKLYREAGWQKD